MFENYFSLHYSLFSLAGLAGAILLNTSTSLGPRRLHLVYSILGIIICAIYLSDQFSNLAFALALGRIYLAAFAQLLFFNSLFN